MVCFLNSIRIIAEWMSICWATAFAVLASKASLAPVFGSHARKQAGFQTFFNVISRLVWWSVQTFAVVLDRVWVLSDQCCVWVDHGGKAGPFHVMGTSQKSWASPNSILLISVSHRRIFRVRGTGESYQTTVEKTRAGLRPEKVIALTHSSGNLNFPWHSAGRHKSFGVLSRIMKMRHATAPKPMAKPSTPGTKKPGPKK